MANDIIQTIVDWISMVPPIGIYLIFFLIAYLENLIPPMPGDVLLAFSGYLAAEGILSVGLMWFVTVIASVLGFMNMYWIGGRLGEQIFDKHPDHFLFRFINRRYFRKGRVWMYRYGQWVVFANRFLAGTRSVISITAGISRLNTGRTILNSALSSALWNGILLSAGWLIRDNWQIIGHYLSVYGRVILVCIGILLLFRLFWLKKYQSGKELE